MRTRVKRKSRNTRKTTNTRKTRKTIKGGGLIQYNNLSVNSQDLTGNSRVQKAPTVSLPNSLIVMHDPDAPSPSYLHWIALTDSNGQLQIITPYKPPTPPSGTHRYIFEIFHRPQTTVQPIPIRQGFSINNFISEYKLNRKAPSVSFTYSH
jgi:phosphatidylethanolamine-binding protein (PEBP) family uncharacterized protein